MNSRMKWLVVGSSTCIAVVLLTGMMLGKTADQSSSDTYKHLRVFSEVVGHIKEEYVEEPDMKAVSVGALNGMLEAVDPFASYLNADQYRDYLKNKDGHRADVGLILSKKFGYLGVLDSEIAHVLGLDEFIGAGGEGAALRRGQMAPAQSAGERRVQAGDGRSGGGDGARTHGAGGGIAGDRPGAVIGSSRGPGTGNRGAGGPAQYAGGNAAPQAARLRLAQPRFRQ